MQRTECTLQQRNRQLSPGSPATTNPAVMVNNPGLSILSAMQCSDSHAHVHGRHALQSMCSLQVSCRWLCVLQQLCHHLYVSTECMSLDTAVLCMTHECVCVCVCVPNGVTSLYAVTCLQAVPGLTGEAAAASTLVSL